MEIRKCVGIVVLTAGLGWHPPATAEEFKRESDALALISSFAASLCNAVKAEGREQAWETSVDAKAKLNDVISKVAELGASGAVKYKSSEYAGVLRQDLGKVLSEQSSCRLEVFRTLQAKLLSSQQPTSKNSAILSEVFEKIFVSDVRGSAPIVLGMPEDAFRKSARNSRALWREEPDDDGGRTFSTWSEDTHAAYGYYLSFNKKRRLDGVTATFSAYILDPPPQATYDDKLLVLQKTQQTCAKYQAIVLRISQAAGSPLVKPKIVFGSVSINENSLSDDPKKMLKYEYKAVKASYYSQPSRGWVETEWTIQKKTRERLAETEEEILRPSGEDISCRLNITFGSSDDDGMSFYNSRNDTLHTLVRTIKWSYGDDSDHFQSKSLE